MPLELMSFVFQLYTDIIHTQRKQSGKPNALSFFYLKIKAVEIYLTVEKIIK